MRVREAFGTALLLLGASSAFRLSPGPMMASRRFSSRRSGRGGDEESPLRAKLPILELRYFPLLAKGLGPTLVLEHSGLAWAGNRDLPFSIAAVWIELKPTTPFGQLPLLRVAGLPPLAQACAIINYVGKVAATEGDTPAQYAWSQMLLAEAEDIYTEMNKFLPTVYKRLSEEGIITSKGDLSDYHDFWQTRLPAHLERLERLLAERDDAAKCEPPRKKAKLVAGSDDSGSSSRRAVSARREQYLPGELHLFSMLYQAWLVEPSTLKPYAALRGWFDAVRAHPRTQTVLRGQSSMGDLGQYYQSADSKDVCRDGDERGRWG